MLCGIGVGGAGAGAGPGAVYPSENENDEIPTAFKRACAPAFKSAKLIVTVPGTPGTGGTGGGGLPDPLPISFTASGKPYPSETFRVSGCLPACLSESRKSIGRVFNEESEVEQYMAARAATNGHAIDVPDIAPCLLPGNAETIRTPPTAV